ncbi:MAG: hypothetical protein R3B54_07345 [Bdellovibrionota bacterium]
MSTLKSVCTFSSPFSVHQIGLQLKRRHGIPWLAYCSDVIGQNPILIGLDRQSGS